MWGFIVALISGALMSILGVFNTEVTKQTSQYSSYLIFAVLHRHYVWKTEIPVWFATVSVLLKYHQQLQFA